jgi:alpha-L-fucosidase
MAETRPDIMAPGSDDGGDFEQPPWLAERLEWFQDLKFGLFMHWGPYSQWGCIESWPLVEEDAWGRPDDLKPWVERGKDLERFRRDYYALNRTFDPRCFDPAPWAALAERAGMKYVAFTTKHHDGFCMFDTRTTDYRITHPDCPYHTSPRANVALEVFDAFRARGMGISCYFSKSDWHCPWYWSPDRPAHTRNPNYDTHAEPEKWARFVSFVHRQVEELMTGYGHIDALWLDGGQVRPPDQDIAMARMAAMARVAQPGLIVADRTVGGPYENILTPEQEIPDEPLGSAWESCLTMGDSWAYRANDRYKSTRTLLHMLIETVAGGGNLLLNIGPSPEGVLPADAVSRLRDLGDWMQVNSPAIHSTRPMSPHREGNIRYVSRGREAFALVLPESDRELPPAELRLTAHRPAPGSAVFLLGHAEPLAWRVESEAAVVTLPVCAMPCAHAWALRFTPR